MSNVATLDLERKIFSTILEITEEQAGKVALVDLEKQYMELKLRGAQ